jgi:hypothetical protein
MQCSMQTSLSNTHQTKQDGRYNTTAKNKVQKGGGGGKAVEMCKCNSSTLSSSLWTRTSCPAEQGSDLVSKDGDGAAEGEILKATCMPMLQIDDDDERERKDQRAVAI